MVIINMHLQDGFKDDTVILEVNNKEVFKGEHITTDPRIALAKQFKTNVSNGEVEVKVNITTKDLMDNYIFMINSETYLGISIMKPESPNRKIRFVLSTDPFAYL